jgi:hypothetical protein
MAFSLHAEMNLAPPVKAMVNLGATMDIPTGKFLQGKYGEMILNAGLGNLTGITGQGNQFKTTVEQYMTFTLLCRFLESTGSRFDTEINTHFEGMRRLYQSHPEWNGVDWLDTKRFRVTDRTLYSADEWYDIKKKWMQDKAKAKDILRDTPFITPEGETIQIPIPTIDEVDSFSEFIAANAEKTLEENSIGESGQNMLHMNAGRAKTAFLMEVPPLAQAAYNYMILTAHVGKEFNLDPRAGVAKVMQYLKQGLKFKGATEKFTFIMNNCWYLFGATALVNETTKEGPQYPRDSSDKMKGDTDLNEVNMVVIRGKSGPSGNPIKILVSQSEGVQPSLTEFHYMRGIKDKSGKRWGFSGNDQNYELDLLPGEALSRTSIRGKIKTNSRLRRALNIASEMCQMNQLWHNLPEGLMCTPKELYDDLKAKGYNWDQLLDTRGWWTTDNDKHPVPFLSSMDLLRMRTGEYKPYWMKT